MSIKINIVTDFFGDGIKRAKAEFDQLEGTGKKIGFALEKAFLPAVGILGALGKGAQEAIQAASDLEESQSKVGVIFGEAGKDVKDFASTSAKNLGLSRREALKAAGTFGVFGKAAGLAGTDLSDFSNDFTELAVDMASFNNTSPEDAIMAIGAALRGESEPIRRYGVLLDDAKLKQSAMELGIYDGIGALTAQEKTLAAQKEIFKQTGDAQGDFARTGDGLANSSKLVKAQMDDLKVSIGEQLLPVVQELLPYIKNFADWAAENPETFKNIALAIGAIAAATVALNLAMMVNPYVAAAAGILAMALAFDQLYRKVEKINTIGGIGARVLGFIFGGAAGRLSSMLKVEDLVRDIFGVGDGKGTSAGTGGLGGGLMNELKGVPGLASGGVVTKPGLFMLAEGGESEAVIPLSKLGNMGGGMTITINAGLVSTPDQIGQEIIQAIQKAQRRSGVVFAPA